MYIDIIYRVNSVDIKIIDRTEEHAKEEIIKIAKSGSTIKLIEIIDVK